MDKSDFKMTQTDLQEFEIHDKPSGTLLATISREPGGAWSTRPENTPDGDSGAAFDDQAKPQAAFNAFILRASADTSDQ